MFRLFKIYTIKRVVQRYHLLLPYANVHNVGGIYTQPSDDTDFFSAEKFQKIIIVGGVVLKHEILSIK